MTREQALVMLQHAVDYCDEQWGIAEHDPQSDLTPAQRSEESENWQWAASILDGRLRTMEREFVLGSSDKPAHQATVLP